MIRALAAVLVLAVAGVTVYLVVRPGQEVTSGSEQDIVITCDGSTGVTAEECRSWGDEVLALGPPSTTFEMKDVNHLRFSRPMLGFGSPCQVDYYIERDPEVPAWEDDVACKGGD
jgi:hypothetical protein